ncbi:hypothetical protein BDR07DRAFT_546128 [Suillus spraguei]|nr:hypothetical protein BDR07DRAFT_546128 [Suillus spraguei]
MKSSRSRKRWMQLMCRSALSKTCFVMQKLTWRANSVSCPKTTSGCFLAMIMTLRQIGKKMTLATSQIHLLLDMDHTTCQMDHILIDFTLDLYPLSMSASVKRCCAKFDHYYKIGHYSAPQTGRQNLLHVS